MGIINIHPSLIPSFCGPGYYGIRPHEAALEYGVKLTGATVHLVDGAYDHGPIILQRAVPVLPDDTPQSLQQRVMRDAEQVLLPRAVALLPPAVSDGAVGSSRSKRRHKTMKRALISVSDKTGLTELAGALAKLDYELVSTGGTAAQLEQAGLKVTRVSDVTGFPECLDGRVKTLHPKIHGGLLAVRTNPDHMHQLEELAIHPIDLVVINLYPFRKHHPKGRRQP